MSELGIRGNVRAVPRAAALVMVGLAVQLGCAFFWGPAAFLLSVLLGMPLVVGGALLGWLYRARNLAASPEDE